MKKSVSEVMSGEMESDQGEGLRENRFLLAILTLGHLVNDLMAGSIWILAPAIAASLGLGPAEVGLILTVNGVAAGLIYIPAGIISDRFSSQGVLMMMTFWWVALGYFLATLVPGFWPVTLMLALGVMGDAFWHPVATGTLVKSMPGRKAQVLGIHAMGGSVGAEILGPIGIGFLLGYFSWQTSLQIMVVPCVLMGLVFIVAIPRIRNIQGNPISMQKLKSLGRTWMQPRGVQMISIMVFYNMALYGILAMTPLILQQNYGFSPFLASVIFAGMLVFGTICQPFIGRVSDTAGRKSLILQGLGVSAVSALVAGMVSGFVPFLLALVIAASLLTAIRPVIMAAAVELSGESESTTLGVVFAMLDGVGALGALVAGYAGEFNLSLAFVFSAILAALSVIVSACTRFPEHRIASGAG